MTFQSISKYLIRHTYIQARLIGSLSPFRDLHLYMFSLVMVAVGLFPHYGRFVRRLVAQSCGSIAKRRTLFSVCLRDYLSTSVSGYFAQSFGI